MEKRRISSLITALFIGLGPFLTWGPEVAAAPALPLLPHAPIIIVNETGFSAANGVTAGSGTPSDPYIIEGWSIDARGSWGLYASGANISLVVRNIEVLNSTIRSGCCASAIRTVVQAVTLENVTVRDGQVAIDVSGTQDAEIRNTTVLNISQTGVALRYGQRVVFEGNAMEGPGIFVNSGFADLVSSLPFGASNLVNGAPFYYLVNQTGLTIEDTPVGQIVGYNTTNLTVSNVSSPRGAPRLDLTYADGARVLNNTLSRIYLRFGDRILVEGNTLVPNATSLVVSEITNGSVRGNSLDRTATGIQVLDSTDMEILNNTVDGTRGQGLWVASVREVRIDGNRVNGTLGGVRLNDLSNATFSRNVVTGNRGTVDVRAVAQIEIEGNEFRDNEFTGLALSSVVDASVRNNTFSGHLYAGISISETYFVNMSGNLLTDDGISLSSGAGSGEELIWNEISTDNLINGLPIRFFKNCTNLVVDGLPTGQLIVANCTGVRAANLALNGSETPASFQYVGGATLENTVIRGGLAAVTIYGAEEVTIRDTSISDCLEAVTAYNVFDITFSRVTIDNCTDGFLVSGAAVGRLDGNAVTNTGGSALQLDGAAYFSLTSNQFDSGGPMFSGSLLENFNTFSIDETNRVAGNPIRYFANCSDTRIEGPARGPIIVANCKGVTVANVSVAKASYGISMAFVKDAVVEEVNVSGNFRAGLYVAHGDNVTLTNVTAQGNGATLNYYGYPYYLGCGLEITNSQNVNIRGARAAGNLQLGLCLTNVGNSTVEHSEVSGHRSGGLSIATGANLVIRENRFDNNSQGVGAGSGTHTLYIADNVFTVNDRALQVSNTDRVTVEGNTFEGTNGSAVYARGARHLVVRDNDFRNGVEGVNLTAAEASRIEANRFDGNQVGVALYRGENVVVFHNFFENNTVHAWDDSDRDNWNGAATVGGNYWSGYAGADHCRGLLQDDCSGPDGFGDTPVAIAAPPTGRFYTRAPFVNATDYYPLMTASIPPPLEPPAGTPDRFEPTPFELLQMGLVGLFAVVGGAALWVYAASVRGRKPPQLPPP